MSIALKFPEGFHGQEESELAGSPGHVGVSSRFFFQKSVLASEAFKQQQLPGCVFLIPQDWLQCSCCENWECIREEEE